MISYTGTIFVRVRSTTFNVDALERHVFCVANIDDKNSTYFSKFLGAMKNLLKVRCFLQPFGGSSVTVELSRFGNTMD